MFAASLRRWESIPGMRVQQRCLLPDRLPRGSLHDGSLDHAGPDSFAFALTDAIARTQAVVLV